MPELPDIEAYLIALHREIVGRTLEGFRLGSPFWLRSVSPPPKSAIGRPVEGVSRLGKRVVLEFEGELFFVLHLMIAGRLRWRKSGVNVPKRRGLGALDFEHGTLLVTEEGSQKRASLHVVEGRGGLAAHDPGGLDLFEIGEPEFAAVLRARNHTLKRALTDPRILSGIGNAYSDEILHRARLSPFRQTGKMTDEELGELLRLSRAVLAEWRVRLGAEASTAFPEKVTAFRPEMAVHGKYGDPCPTCGTPVQRIRYASNECNYCPTCQTEGRLLADRALSRLLKKDWPKTLEELEARLGRS